MLVIKVKLWSFGALQLVLGHFLMEGQLHFCKKTVKFLTFEVLWHLFFNRNFANLNLFVIAIIIAFP